jgi:peptidyl-prolyl cis-trans isomerase D
MVMRSLRKNINVLKWMFVLLLIVFGVGLVLPGSLSKHELANAAAVVDGHPISQERYSRLLSVRLEQTRRRLGGELSEAESLKVRRETLGDLIDEQLALQHARDLGQSMSAEEFRDMVLNDPSLKDKQGRFDQQKYLQILASQAEEGEKVQAVEDKLQRGILLGKVRGFWEAQALLTPSEVEAAVARLNRQVKAEAAVWNLEAVRRTLTLPEEDLRSYYSRNKSRWVKPEEYKLRQILIRTEFGQSSATAKAKAEDILAKLKAGADFKTLASTENADEAARKNAGSLGTLAKGDLRDPGLAAAVARLKVGGISEVITTSEGFHILKLEGKTPGFEPTFENSRTKVLEALGKERAAREAEKRAGKVLADLRAGKSLAEAARAHGGTYVQTAWFGRDDEQALPGFGKSLVFSNTMLSLDKGESVEAPLLSETAVAVARLIDERPGPAPKGEAAETRRRTAIGQARAKKAQDLYEGWIAGLKKTASIVDHSGTLPSPN